MISAIYSRSYSANCVYCRGKIQVRTRRPSRSHSAPAAPLPTAASLSPRARKRQRIDDDDHDDPIHTTANGANTNGPVWRGVELETAVERFRLCMYEADSDNGTDAGNKDAGGSDKTKTLAEDQQQQSGGEVTHVQSGRRRWEIWFLGSLDDDNRDTPPPPLSMWGRWGYKGEYNDRRCDAAAARVARVEPRVRGGR
ncbi:hypothetical protein BJV78DRAFT_1204456, partial [Lactifluus subvellereus]